MSRFSIMAAATVLSVMLAGCQASDNSPSGGATASSAPGANVPTIALSSASTSSAANASQIFNGAMATGWLLNNWNWNPSSAAISKSTADAGVASIQATEGGAWSGVTLDHVTSGNAVDLLPSSFVALDFDFNPGPKAATQLATLQIMLGSTGSGVNLSTYLPSPAANAWSHVRIPLSAFSAGKSPFMQIVFFNNSASGSFSFYLANVFLEQATPTAATAPSGVLYTQGNHIFLNGQQWMGRGADLFDARQNDACYDKWVSDPTFSTRVAGVKKLIDALVGQWKANFIRLTLETDWGDDNLALVNDPAYLSSIVEIVDYIGTKPGVYVIVTPWLDPSKNILENISNEALGIPSIAPALLPAGQINEGTPSNDASYYTSDVLLALVNALSTRKQVIWGLGNEPTNGNTPALDQAVWEQHNNMVQLIRNREAALGSFQHLISVQGTRNWSRDLNYYVTHPITAGGGTNIIYEAHIYDSSSEFDALVTEPAKTLPVVIGEFGPDAGTMTVADTSNLMTLAESLKVPYLAWSFSGKSPGFNLINDAFPNDCDFSYVGGITPTSGWGTTVQSFLGKAGL